jgi:hypothetical protein
LETECAIEIRKDGTKFCSLHKQSLFETTALDEVKNGVYLDMKNTFFCPVGKTEITTPFTLSDNDNESRYVVLTVECTRCHRKQDVHVYARGRDSQIEQTVVCTECLKPFSVLLQDEIVSGRFL